jgi:hypothetical protein
MDGRKFRFHDNHEFFHTACSGESHHPTLGQGHGFSRSQRLAAPPTEPPHPGEHHRYCTAGEIASELGYSVGSAVLQSFQYLDAVIDDWQSAWGQCGHFDCICSRNREHGPYYEPKNPFRNGVGGSSGGEAHGLFSVLEIHLNHQPIGVRRSLKDDEQTEDPWTLPPSRKKKDEVISGPLPAKVRVAGAIWFLSKRKDCGPQC